jgi:transcriptional regulator with XRE-family HTH domain
MPPQTTAPEGTSLAEALRQDKGLSAVQVARLTGVSHKTVLKYEREGMLNPHTDKVHALARLYGVRPAVLLADLRRTYYRQEDAEHAQDAA